MDTKTYPVPLSPTENQIASLLCNACEGGSGYWCRSEDYPYKDAPHKKGQASALILNLPVRFCDIEERNSDGDLELRPVELNDEDFSLVLDEAAILRGLSLLPTVPRHLAAILGDDADAETGDVFLPALPSGRAAV